MAYAWQFTISPTLQERLAREMVRRELGTLHKTINAILVEASEDGETVERALKVVGRMTRG